MDEMHIKEGLVYDKHTGDYCFSMHAHTYIKPSFIHTCHIGAITGFTDLGDINNHLIALEMYMAMEDHEVSSTSLANSMLVLLVKGLFSKLSCPYTQFSCTSICGDQMYDIFWEAVSRLELMGFRVMALTCDGLSAN